MIALFFFLFPQLLLHNFYLPPCLPHCHAPRALRREEQSKERVYRAVQLDFTMEIELFCMLFDSC